MYVMRNMIFTVAFISNNCRDIASSPAFDFGYSDMDRFRAEINALVRKLSSEYLLLKGTAVNDDEGGNNGVGNSNEDDEGNLSEDGDDDSSEDDDDDDSSGNHKPGHGEAYSAVSGSLMSPCSLPPGMEEHYKEVSDEDREIGGVIPARMRPELNRLEDNASTDGEQEEKTRFIQKRLIMLRETVHAKTPKKTRGPRKFRLQKVHRYGTEPICRGCNETIRRGDKDFDHSWHMVTGKGHYHHYCIGNLTREERWKIFAMARSLNKSGDMDSLTFEAFNEQMQIAEEFPDFMPTPDHSDNDEYE